MKIINYSSQYYVTWLYFWKNFRYGLSENEAGAKFFILDENGLITKARKNLLELEENFYSLTTFAEDDTSMEGMGLLEVCIKSVKIFSFFKKFLMLFLRSLKLLNPMC